MKPRAHLPQRFQIGEAFGARRSFARARSACSAVWRKRSANGWAAASAALTATISPPSKRKRCASGASGATVNPNASTADAELTKLESRRVEPMIHRRDHCAGCGHCSRASRQRRRSGFAHRQCGCRCRREAAKLGIGRARPARLPQRIASEIVHELRMPESHLDLGRMDVDVHLFVGQIHEE